MAKKRKNYEAPVGRQLPEAPENPGRGELWLWVGECLRSLETWVPFEHQPETLRWNDPLEAGDKERAEKLAIEEAFSGEVRRAFQVLREEGLWPDTSAQACFLMRVRLEWAIHMTNQFRLLARSAGCGALKPVPGVPLDVCQWIAFDLYDAGFSWPGKWWDSSSFEERCC